MNAPKWDETEAYSAPAASATAPKWEDTEEVASPGSGKSVGGFLGNAVSDAGNIVGGATSLAGNMISHPIDTTASTIKGIPTAVKELANAWGIPEVMHGQFADAIKKIGNSVYDKPVSRALDVASIAMPALKGAGIIKGVEGADLANAAGKAGEAAEDMANINRVKNLGARTKAFSELGEDEATRIGARAKELDMTGGAKSTLAKGEGLLEDTGKQIGDARKIGDQLKAAPTMDDINAAIESHLKDKYTKGLGAGEGTEFNRAVEDVNKLKSNEPAMIRKPGVKQVFPEPGQQNLLDDSRLASSATEGTKDVPGLRQMDFPPKQMDLIDRGTPELFPKDPTEGVVVPEIKKVPTASQSAVPDLSGPQDLGPTDPTASKLIETMNEVPNPKFAGSQPGTSDIARKATDMNAWARNEKSLLRPSGAASDVANVLSSENDAALVHALGSEYGKDYVGNLAKHSDLEKMTQMLGEKRARELGVSQAPGSLASKGVNWVKDRFGYRLNAAVLDRVATFLKTNPEKFGKYAGVLNHAMVGGPAALATTVDLLSQNDPAFAKQMGELQ